MAEGELVRFENVNGVGVITVDNPPVNALSPGVPEGIVAAVERGNADPAIRAMVLIGAGRSFIAGADIRTFGTNRPPPVEGRRPHQVLDKSEKPVVAAIHGYALGGGLELALASNYRIAVPSARVGLPEVLIGILPGSGGTQRLPRIIGPKAAMEMIVSGRHVPAEEAHRLGIIDEIIPEGGDLRERAIAFAHLVADKRPLPRIREHDEKLAEAKTDPGIFDAMRRQIARRARGQPAPLSCIAAVEAACSLPFDDGIHREREIFNELENSPEARALRYAFFAERECAKLPDIPRDTPLRPIKTAAIVGAGTMGGGISMSFAEFGFPVRLLEASKEALDRGLARIRANYETSVRRGSLSEAEMNRRLALIEPVLELRRHQGLRRRHRGRVRAHPGQGRGVQKARRDHEAGGAALYQHIRHRHRHHGECDTKAAGRGRHPFLRTRQRHEAVRGRQRCEKRPRHPCDGDGSRAQNRQDQCDGRQWRRLCRKPQPHAVRYRDEHHGRGRGAAGAGRQGHG